MRTLYVGGLAAEATEAHLRSAFSGFGTLDEARVVLKASTGECRGFGYVTFRAEDAALRAMESLNGRAFDGNRWRVDLAD